ncbi:MAG: nucleotidyltransferase domain-containing protein [Fibromonadaceae bacterium]|jgi:predicted nucleotidyltransferase|nr:nucleotidyltransferase domain-containing protein [Fibromonadaceae bacterium]
MDKQTFGISQNALDRIKSVLFSMQGVEQVILYGSRAKGNYKEGSDIDLAIKGNLTFEDLVKISVNLDDLNLPWKIDLSLYSQIKNEKLLEHINRVGKEI